MKKAKKMGAVDVNARFGEKPVNAGVVLGVHLVASILVLIVVQPPFALVHGKVSMIRALTIAAIATGVMAVLHHHTVPISTWTAEAFRVARSI